MYLLQTCNKIVFVNKPLNVNTGIYKKKIYWTNFT